MSIELQLEQDAFRKLYPEEHFDRFVQEGLRPDHRILAQFREVSISCDIVSTAASSASVKLGNTHVIAGIKLEVEAPADDAKDQGRLQVQVTQIIRKCACASRLCISLRRLKCVAAK